MTHDQWELAAFIGWSVFLFIVAAIMWVHTRRLP